MEAFHGFACLYQATKGVDEAHDAGLFRGLKEAKRVEKTGETGQTRAKTGLWKDDQGRAEALLPRCALGYPSGILAPAQVIILAG